MVVNGVPVVVRPISFPVESRIKASPGSALNSKKPFDVMSDGHRKTFQEHFECDFAYKLDDATRFRVNAFRQRGAVSFAFRVIPRKVPNFAELGLPRGVERLASEHRGLILVTGATGSRAGSRTRSRSLTPGCRICAGSSPRYTSA